MPFEYFAECHDVHDGDSAKFVVSLGFNVAFGPTQFRFYGINTPEMDSEDPALKKRAEAARQFVVDRLMPPGEAPKIKVTTFKADQDNVLDKYGRGLAAISYQVVPPKPPKIKGKKQEPAPEPYWVNLCDELVKAGHALPYFGEGEKPV